MVGMTCRYAYLNRPLFPLATIGFQGLESLGRFSFGKRYDKDMHFNPIEEIDFRKLSALNSIEAVSTRNRCNETSMTFLYRPKGEPFVLAEMPTGR
jgi:hypothetical protein